MLNYIHLFLAANVTEMVVSLLFLLCSTCFTSFQLYNHFLLCVSCSLLACVFGSVLFCRITAKLMSFDLYLLSILI